MNKLNKFIKKDGKLKCFLVILNLKINSNLVDLAQTKQN